MNFCSENAMFVTMMLAFVFLITCTVLSVYIATKNVNKSKYMPYIWTSLVLGIVCSGWYQICDASKN